MLNKFIQIGKLFSITKNFLKYSTLNQHNMISSTRLKGMGESVFAEFTNSCIANEAVNLGQGFPNYAPPKFVQECLQEVSKMGVITNQYNRSMGHPILVNQLQNIYEPLLNRKLTQMNFVITNGATGALFTICQALLNPRDEALLLEPFYDAYPNQVQMAGGVCKYLPFNIPKDCISSNQINLDFKKLDSMINNKTKLLFINNPHNPTGKCWNKEEFLELSRIIQRHPNLFVVMDEAYEWLVFDDNQHVRFASLPGMWNRTITVGSAGKSFECTGWKIGWVCASEEITNIIQMAHQWIPFCTSIPLQCAIGLSLKKQLQFNWFEELRNKLQNRRDALVDGLNLAGMRVIIPQGGYFVLANTSNFDYDYNPHESKDFEFARWIIRTHKVGPIPPSAFYSPKNAYIAEDYARFAFCKSDSLIDAGLEKLKAIE